MSKLPIKSWLAVALFVTTLRPLPTAACGNEPFIGEICTFAFNFCPVGFAPAEGQLISIAENEALFSLFGTIYGGNGTTTFALPDLRGRFAVGAGQGQGLSNYILGEMAGAESVALNLNNMPIHSHPATTIVTVNAMLNAVGASGNGSNPAGKSLAVSTARDNLYSDTAPIAAMASGAITTTANANTTIGPAGGSAPFSIRSPYLGLKHCVAVSGIYPSRS